MKAGRLLEGLTHLHPPCSPLPSWDAGSRAAWHSPGSGRRKESDADVAVDEAQ